LFLDILVPDIDLRLWFVARPVRLFDRRQVAARASEKVRLRGGAKGGSKLPHSKARLRRAFFWTCKP
jgi:hypothetical protein